MQTLWQDLRYGARMLMKQPGFTLIAVITLALGIGANTAIFSVVNAVLLRPLPYPQPERIVRLWDSNATRNLPQFSVTFPNFSDWRQQNQVFEKMAAYREDGFNLQTGDEPRRVNGARVTADFFAVLGVQPAIGRAFSPQEDTPGGERVVILSHALWQQSFGGDGQLIGRQIRFDGQACKVVGVMPSGFRFPNEQAEVWLPYQLDAARYGRGPHFLRVLGRLQAGATMQQARTELDTIARRLEQAYPDTNKDWRVFMLPLDESLSGELQRPLYVLLGAVAFVLLIACANVANLLLARHAARERELAIRTALGAGRWRIVRQLLTESFLLALAGSVGALLIATWGVDLLKKLGPRDIPRLQEAALDAPVLGFTLALGVLTGLIFGLAPAWQRTRLNPNLALKDGARTTGGGQRLRQSLVVAEIALALMLLIGGGLILKGFWRLQQVAPGFQAQGALTLELNMSPAKYARPEQRAAYLQQVLERLQALPGVTFAGATHRLPLRGNSGNTFQIEGRPVPEAHQRPAANYRAITPDYFKAMGTPLIAGRTFTAAETWQRPSAVIINQTFARRYWPNENPLGQRLRFSNPNNPPLEIIGIAADTKENGLDSETQSGLYVPYSVAQSPAMTLVLRPMSGYDIKQHVNYLFRHFWNESYGSIYPVLKRLEAEGWATCKTEKSAGKPERRLYTITRQGREALRTWLREPTEPLRVRHELLLKLVFGTNLPLAENIENLARHRDQLLAQQLGLQELVTLIEDDPPEQQLYSTLVLRLGQGLNEARLAWCDEALQQLRQAARTNKPSPPHAKLPKRRTRK